MNPASYTLIWIDSEQAKLYRWDGSINRNEVITSDVPGKRRSNGHVRRGEGMLHSGGGAAVDAGEGRRQEHLERYLANVLRRIDRRDALEIAGPGVVHERLAAMVLAADRQAGRQRPIRCAAAGKLTEHQLSARLMELMGITPTRGFRL